MTSLPRLVSRGNALLVAFSFLSAPSTGSCEPTRPEPRVAENPSDEAELAKVFSFLALSRQKGDDEVVRQTAKMLLDATVGMPPKSRLRAQCLHEVAFDYQYLGKLDEAEAHFHRAVEAKREAFGKRDPSTANTLNSLGELYRWKGEPAKAIPWLREARDILLPGADAARPTDILGLTYVDMGELETGEKFHRRALKLRLSVRPPAPEGLIKSWQHLGIVCTMRGKLREASGFYEKALAAAEKRAGVQSLLAAGLRAGLANVYWMRGERTKSEKMLAAAAAVLEETQERGLELAGLLEDVGAAFIVRSDYERAEPYYEKSFAIKKKHLGVHAQRKCPGLTAQRKCLPPVSRP